MASPAAAFDPLAAAGLDPAAGAIIYGVNKLLKPSPPKNPPPKPLPGQAGGGYLEGDETFAYKLAFAPGAQASALLIQEIGLAKKSIFMASSLFASKKIADALVRAHKKGVRVMLVADAGINQKAASKLGRLAQEGVSCRVNDKYGLLAHKFLIRDGSALVLINMGVNDQAAKKEAASVLVLCEAPKLAGAYLDEWRKLYREGVPISPARDYGISAGKKNVKYPKPPAIQESPPESLP